MFFLPEKWSCFSLNPMQLQIKVFFESVFNYFPPRSFSLRCSCEEQPALGARPPAKPNLDDAAPGSPGAFSFLLRPLCRRSPLSPPTALLLRPSPSRRGPRTAKGALINHLTRSPSVFIHPSGSLFSFFFFFCLVFTTSNLHSSFLRNNGVVLSCTFCGKIYSAVRRSVTHSSSLGLFSSILTTSRRPPPQLFGVPQ